MPNYDMLFADTSGFGIQTVMAQAQHPFTAHHYNPESHEAKMVLRLVPPLVGRALHLGVVGYCVFQFLCFVILGYALARVLLRASESAAIATMGVIAMATAMPGMLWNDDLRGLFDGTALMFMILAMLFRNPLAIAACLFLGEFTDERAIIAAPLIFGFHLMNDGREFPTDWRTLLRGNWRSAAVIAAVLACLAAREALYLKLGLATGRSASDLWYIEHNINEWGVGVWSGLEGGWLVVAAGLLVLLLRRAYLLFAGLALSVLVIAVAAISVFDISRSAVYALPAFVAATGIVTASEKNARPLFFWAMLASVLWPTYYVTGTFKLHWVLPMPLSLVRFGR